MKNMAYRISRFNKLDSTLDFIIINNSIISRLFFEIIFNIAKIAGSTETKIQRSNSFALLSND